MNLCGLLILSSIIIDAITIEDNGDVIQTKEDRKKDILKSGLKTLEDLRRFHLKLCLQRWFMFNTNQQLICNELR